MKPIYYAGEICDGVGWGTCNMNLSRELAKLTELVLIPAGYTVNELDLVFTPIADHNLRPAFSGRAKHLVGYGFFEFPLGPLAQQNCNDYDLIFTGSTWCSEWVRSQLKAPPPIETLIQGVDSDLFRPEPVEHFGWTIFSGGKFEWRKGQDLTIKAVAKMQELHTDVYLIGTWWNPWPEVVLSMRKSELIKFELLSGELELNHLCDVNGCDPSRVIMLGRTPHRSMPAVMNQCDVAILPSRSEGGTNLPLMEAMACGLPCVATALRGHNDILTPANSYGCAADVDELVDGLEFFYRDRETARAVGRMARHDMEKWTWKRTAETAVEIMKKYGILC